MVKVAPGHAEDTGVSTLRRLILAAAVLGAVLAVGGPASAAPAPGAAEDQFYASVNSERGAARLAPLTADPALDAIAIEWSGRMANENRLYHRPDYRAQVEARVTTAWTRIGENVGKGYDVPSLHAAFMASAGHRAMSSATTTGWASASWSGVTWSGSPSTSSRGRSSSRHRL